jgi:hypothetical protein
MMSPPVPAFEGRPFSIESAPEMGVCEDAALMAYQKLCQKCFRVRTPCNVPKHVDFTEVRKRPPQQMADFLGKGQKLHKK